VLTIGGVRKCMIGQTFAISAIVFALRRFEKEPGSSQPAEPCLRATTGLIPMQGNRSLRTV
jgi:hypothetical protein